MKENLIKISDYIESLERRIAALEARMIAAEQLNSALADRLQAAEERIAALEARPAAAAEPEVEVEFIMPDDEPEDLPAPAEETPIDEAPVAEPVPQPQPQVEDKPLPAEEPAPHPVPQPAPAPAPAPAEPARQTAQSGLTGAPVADIRQAISLGDRFLFQRELFGGNGELMQKTLETLNALSSLQEAVDYTGKHFNWDKESTAAELFMNVLRRRFS